MNRLPWHSSREIAVKIKGLTDEADIRQCIRNLIMNIYRGIIPQWAYRKKGRVYEFNPNYFIAPDGLPVPVLRPMGISRLVR